MEGGAESHGNPDDMIDAGVDPVFGFPYFSSRLDWDSLIPVDTVILMIVASKAAL